MSIMVWIKVHIKEGKMDEYMNLHNSPKLYLKKDSIILLDQ